MIRTRLYDLLASAVTRHPRLAEDVNGDEDADGADAEYFQHRAHAREEYLRARAHHVRRSRETARCAAAARP